MTWEVAESKNTPGEWVVEAINRDGDGEIYAAIFSGPNAEQRAREYAACKQEQTDKGLMPLPQYDGAVIAMHEVLVVNGIDVSLEDSTKIMATIRAYIRRLKVKA